MGLTRTYEVPWNSELVTGFKFYPERLVVLEICPLLEVAKPLAGLMQVATDPLSIFLVHWPMDWGCLGLSR